MVRRDNPAPGRKTPVATFIIMGMPDDLDVPDPPVGATPAELVAWYEKHEKALSERGALNVVVPQLGDVVNVEVVDGRNPAYPGLTFDYAIHLSDDRRLAVEVAQIVEPTIKISSREVAKFAGRIERLLRDGNITGRWNVTFPTDTPDFRQVDPQKWISAMEALGSGERSAIDGGSIQRLWGDDPFPGGGRILTANTYNYVDLEPAMRARFATALDDNEAKLHAASMAGFDETHLIIWHLFHGSTDTWAMEVKRRTGRIHPQYIWVVANLSDVSQLK